MAVMIAPKGRTSIQAALEPLGTGFSQGFGSTLGTGLELLVQHKINEMQTEKQRKGFGEALKAYGLTDEQRQQLQQAPPHMWPTLIKDIQQRQERERQMLAAQTAPNVFEPQYDLGTQAQNVPQQQPSQLQNLLGQMGLLEPSGAMPASAGKIMQGFPGLQQPEIPSVQPQVQPAAAAETAPVTPKLVPAEDVYNRVKQHYLKTTGDPKLAESKGKEAGNKQAQRIRQAQIDALKERELSLAERKAISAEKRGLSAEELKKQEKIDKRFAPYLNYFRDKLPEVDRATDLANEMERLLKTGKVANNAYQWQIDQLPTSHWNKETQDFMSASNELVQSLTSAQKGQPTGFKLRFTQLTKPLITQRPETQLSILNRIKGDFSKFQVLNKINQGLIEGNDFEIPKDLEIGARKKLDKLEQSKLPFETILAEMKAKSANKNLGEEETTAGIPSIPPTINAQQPPAGPAGTSQVPTELQAQEQLPVEPATSALGKVVGETALTVGEALLGLPGDIISTAYGIPKWLLEKTGMKLPEYERLQKFWPSLFAPTTGQVRDLVSEAREVISGKKAEEPSKMGELYKDIVTDIVQLTVPFAGKIPFKSAITKAIGGNMAAFASKTVLPDHPSLEGGVKLATMLALGTAGGRNELTKAAESKFALTEQLAEGKKTNAKPISNAIKEVEKFAYKGLDTPAKKIMKEQLEKLSPQINLGEIALDEALASEKDINKFFREIEGKQERKMLGKLKDGLEKTIENYGTKNKEFLAAYKDSKEIWKGLNNANIVRQTLDTVLSKPNLLKHATTKALLGGAALYKLGTAKTFGTIGLGLVANEGLKAFDLLRQSPQARNLYLDIVKNTIAKDLIAAERNIRKLDKISGKYEEKSNI